MRKMKFQNLIILCLLLFSKGDKPDFSWRISTTTTDSRQGVTFQDSYYKQYSDKLHIHTKITLPNGAEIIKDQIAEMQGIQTFIIQYPDGSIKAGYITQKVLYEDRARRKIRTRVYVGERLSSETTVVTYNPAIGDF